MVREDGKCPYCGVDCFVSSKTIEVRPYNDNPFDGEWINECINGHRSVCRVRSDGVSEQRTMED